MKRRKVLAVLSVILLVVLTMFVVCFVTCYDYLIERSTISLLPLTETANVTCDGDVLQISDHVQNLLPNRLYPELSEKPSCDRHSIKEFHAYGKLGPDDIFEFEITPIIGFTITINRDENVLTIWAKRLLLKYALQPEISPAFSGRGLCIDQVKVKLGHVYVKGYVNTSFYLSSS
jgi:hypothetical protein